MAKASFQIVVFVFGVSLAVAFVYATRPPSGSASARTAEAAPAPVVWTQVIQPPPAPAAGGANAGQSIGQSLGDAHPEEASERSENEQLLAQLKALTPETRRALLVESVHEGTISSLRFASSSLLVLLPEYHEQLLPTLKREALKALLSRFRDVDWSNWQLSSFARAGGPTAARSYVDLVASVNPELGRFLETAAQLFRAVAASTKAGRPFALRDGLDEVLRTAERPTASAPGVPNAVPRVLDAEILGDAIFRTAFEEIRARLISSYVDAHREQPLLNFQLILSADGGAASEPLTSVLLRLFRQFSLEASPRYREQVFELLLSSPNVERWVKQRPALRRALAQLYLVGAMDAVELEDPRRATLFLDESIRLAPKLRGQELLAEALRGKETGDEPARAQNAGLQAQPANEEARLSEPRPEEPRSEQPQSAARTERSSSTLFSDSSKSSSGERLSSTLRQGISFLSMLLLVLLVAGGGALVFLYRRSLNAVRLRASDLIPAESPKGVRITAPSEMNFDEEFELGSRAKQSPY